jgi:hypothetical protein
LPAICFITVFSQTRLLTIEEATIGQYRQFYPQTIYQLQWKPGSESYSFIKKNGSLFGGFAGIDWDSTFGKNNC